MIPRSDLADRLHGIAHEIEQHLLDLQHVDHHRRQVGRDGRADAQFEAIEIGLAQIDRFADDVIDPASRTIAAVKAHQCAKMPHHAGGAFDLRDRLLCGLGHRVDVRLAGANGIGDQPRVSAGRHQRLVYLVRYGGGEFADAAEPRQPRQRFLMQAQLRLGAVAFGDEYACDKSR